MNTSLAILGDIATIVAVFIGVPTIVALFFYYNQKHVAVLKEQIEILKQQLEIQKQRCDEKISELQKHTSEALLEVLERREAEMQILIEDRDRLLVSQAQKYENRIKAYEDKIAGLQERQGQLQGQLELHELWEARFFGRDRTDKDT